MSGSRRVIASTSTSTSEDPGTGKYSSIKGGEVLE